VSLRRLTIALLLSFVAAGFVGFALAGPAAATPAATAVLHRGGPVATVPFHTSGPGEGLLSVTVSAPDADWATAGAEAAVINVFVDGRHDTDVVIPFAHPIERRYLLGSMHGGRHQLILRFADDSSAPGVDTAVVSRLHVSTVTRHDPSYLAAKYTPVLYGRNLPDYGGPLDNARSDTPLVAWHDVYPADVPGHIIMQISYVWSNEDGGTNTPQLMARWGRTTDIEWIYRVELDQQGRRVPGSDTFQAPNHTTTYFHGRYEGAHAVLDTCTENNNVCDTVDDPMRFYLAAQQTVPPNRPREAIMDANPWTYQVMTAEMRREGKIEATPSPDTAAMSDQRNYLFLAVKKNTVPATNDGSSWVGLSVGVTLRGSARVYRSDHLGTGGATDWSIQRDLPAATTVELPSGTTAADVTSIVAYRVVNGSADPGNAVHVTGIIRGFLLGADYLPGASFLTWRGSVTLTAASPVATIWSAART
jgi:hypothetical protein